MRQLSVPVFSDLVGWKSLFYLLIVVFFVVFFQFFQNSSLKSTDTELRSDQ